MDVREAIRVLRDGGDEFEVLDRALLALRKHRSPESEQLVVSYLENESAMLRARALYVCLGYWCLEEHLERAQEKLRTESDDEARADIASALGSYCRRRRREGLGVNRRLLEGLMKRLREDEDDAVQSACHDALLEALGLRLPQLRSSSFDRDRDVDWKLISGAVDALEL